MKKLIIPIILFFASCTKESAVPSTTVNGANNHTNIVATPESGTDTTVVNTDTATVYSGLAFGQDQCGVDTTEITVYASVYSIDSTTGQFTLFLSAPGLSESGTECVAGNGPVYTSVIFSMVIFDSKGGEFTLSDVGPIFKDKTRYNFGQISKNASITAIYIRHTNYQPAN